MMRLCGARARTNGHLPCRQPAMENGRCRLHGGLTPKHNPGPKTEDGKLRQHMANWKHGLRSKEANKFRQTHKRQIKSFKQNLHQIIYSYF